MVVLQEGKTDHGSDDGKIVQARLPEGHSLASQLVVAVRH